MQFNYVLIKHYIDGHGTLRWCAKRFCEDPKDLAEYIQNNLNHLYHQLDDEDDYYSIERRVGIDRDAYFNGSLEELIRAMRNQ